MCTCGRLFSSPFAPFPPETIPVVRLTVPQTAGSAASRLTAPQTSGSASSRRFITNPPLSVLSPRRSDTGRVQEPGETVVPADGRDFAHALHTGDKRAVHLPVRELGLAHEIAPMLPPTPFPFTHYCVLAQLHYRIWGVLPGAVRGKLPQAPRLWLPRSATERVPGTCTAAYHASAVSSAVSAQQSCIHAQFRARPPVLTPLGCVHECISAEPAWRGNFDRYPPVSIHRIW